MSHDADINVRCITISIKILWQLCSCARVPARSTEIEYSQHPLQNPRQVALLFLSRKLIYGSFIIAQGAG